MEKNDSFDLVLIEAKMPDMDSYEFLRHVTQQINIPIISKYIFIIDCTLFYN
jgi:CheY-like chemotaxis protein